MNLHFKQLINWLGLFALAFLIGCSEKDDELNKRTEVLLQGKTMGTTYTVKVVDTQKHISDLQLHQHINDLLATINQSMSTYIPNSELSQFNQYKSVEPVKISVALQTVISESLRLGELTQGKLDITVGPLVNLWGFGPDFHLDKAPTEEILALTRQNVGLQYLMLEDDTLRKTNPDLYVDLSTTAKGYAVDQVAELISTHGIDNYLVEIGGEMRLKGFKATGELWHIAIEKPITKERVVHQIIVPKDNALATSGEYRNYFEENGQRFSHIIDPDTGKPINHKLVSVTVIHPSSMTADGLATAMMVMGEEQAYQFAQQNDIAAYIISKTDDGFKEQVTVKFTQYLK